MTESETLPITNRIVSFDIIRVIAIFAVILQHCWSMAGYHTLQEGALDKIANPFFVGVPLFIMLSGALLLRSVTPMNLFLKKRFGRIIPPFLFWGTIVYALSCYLQKYPEINSLEAAFKSYVSYLLEGKINDAYWYVYMLIGLYLLAPILQRFFHFSKGDTHKRVQYTLILWAVVLLLQYIYPSMDTFSFYHFKGTLYLGYFIAGYYMTTFMRQQRWNCLVGISLFLISLLLLTLFINHEAIRSLLFILENLGLFLFLSSLDIKRMPTFISNMGKFSYTIYLTHFLVIGFIYQFSGTTNFLGFASPIIVALAVLLICTIFCYLLYRLLPSAGRLFGF